MTDTWMGDDFFHQGAFRLSYGLEYSTMMESAKENTDFDVGTYDMYDWYLRMGTLAHITDSMGKRLPTWRSNIRATLVGRRGEARIRAHRGRPATRG
jgi:hypothetical protein